MRKEVLGWMVDSATQCIKLARDKQSVMDVYLHNIVRMKKGVPFKRIEDLIKKSDTQQQQSQRKKIDDTN